MRRAFMAAALALAACAHAVPEGRPADFVDARGLAPRLVVDMRYAGANNFVGRRIDGYEAPVCLLTREAARALAQAEQALAASGAGLKVFDCYRPARAVAHFVRWARDPRDAAQKHNYYPNVDKSQLFALGYIAERSGHSRGSTVDITLIDLATGQERDMGSPFDLFDPVSHAQSEAVGPAQRANRLLLREAMGRAGFRPLKEEWWHFTLEGEPYPDTYFDFPIRR